MQYNSQIATAAEQQNSVAEDTTRNITQIRDVVDQLAASTERVSADSEELAKLAKNSLDRLPTLKSGSGTTNTIRGN